MKHLLLLWLILLVGTAYSQSAADYFPENTGHKWYYEVTPLDSLNNPVYSLTTVKADTFAAEGVFHGTQSNLLLSKYGSNSTISPLPWIDSNFVDLDGSVASQFYGLQNFTIPGDTGTFPGFAEWFDFYHFTSPVGSNYNIFTFDTTLSYNGQEFPLRFKISSKRLSDEFITTEIGDFNTKKFEVAIGIYYLLEIPPFPTLEIELVAIKNKVWIAPDNWIVKEYQPSVIFDISQYVSIPPFVIPGVQKDIIQGAGEESATIDITSGWNIVSVPLNMEDMNVTSIFPDAVSNAFGFDGGYVQQDILNTGKGYWLKFEEPETFGITGELPPANIELEVGWNMIGVYNSTVDVNQISTSPENIIESNFFGFDNGYSNSESLVPGKGYWIKCSGSGELLLNSGSKKDAPKKQLNLSPIHFEDSNGYSFILYTSENSLEKNELPPLPPAGTQDVRFADNTFITTDENNIKLSNLVYPVKIRLENSDYSLITPQNEIANGELTLLSEPASLKIVTVEQPNSFELSQNYPNPFNPATIISFSLPEAGNVKIIIFDQLGQKISEPVNRNFEAGKHKVEYNASNLVSGIYFYRIQTGKYNAIKKMVLMK